MPHQHGHTWLKQDILELEKVQRRAARFVNNNYWPMASVTEMIFTLNWETLEKPPPKGTSMYDVQSH